MTYGGEDDEHFRGSDQAQADLAQILFTEASLQAVLDLVVTLASSDNRLPTVHGVSVSVPRTRGVETLTASSQEVTDLDEVQYRSGGGPCVTALQQGRVVDITLDEVAGRWPEFARAAQERGVAAVLSIPLEAGERRVGALNFYTRPGQAVDEQGRRLIRRFAIQAGVAVANAVAFATAEVLNAHLEEALESRDVIGQAKGVLMGRDGLSADEAFDVLRETSQRTHRKLRDVAQDVIEGVQRRQPRR